MTVYLTVVSPVIDTQDKVNQYQLIMVLYDIIVATKYKCAGKQEEDTDLLRL